MTAVTLAAAHQRRQQRIADKAAKALAREWRKIDPRNIARSWGVLLSRATSTLALAQLAAAQQSDAYVSASLAAQGVDPAALAVVNPYAFAGLAADGRELASLLYTPVITTLVDIRTGESVRDALSAGLVHLDMLTRTEVADAGRTADGAATVARKTRVGYVRMLELPSCARCVVLAGKFYRWNAGFKRHPQCDCRHIPCAEDAAGDLRTDPMAYFRSLTPDQQNKVFTSAGAQAIRDGADISQVVNARRGLYTAGGKRYTTVSATRRGASPGVRRLTPEQIYIEANGNREEALRLLRRFSYIH